MIRGHFLRTVSYLPYVKQPVTKGHNVMLWQSLQDLEESPKEMK